MKHMIGICLKDNIKVPKDGYVILDDKTVDFIACVDVNKKNALKLTINEFLSQITDFDGYGYVQYDKNEDNYTNPVDITEKQDKLVKEGSLEVECYRNTSNITLFKHKDSTVLLQRYKDRYYFWRNDDYLLILNKYTKELNYNIEKDVNDKLVSPIIYDLFAGQDLKESVYTVMLYLVKDLDYEYNTAKDFVINIFTIGANKYTIQVNKRKVAGLLGLTPTGYSSEKSIREGVEHKNIDIKEVVPIQFRDYVSDYEVYKTATGKDITNKDLMLILSTFREDIEENVKVQKEKLSKRGKKGKQVGAKQESLSADDITKEINQKEFKKGNPSCAKCRGKGYILTDFFGSKQKVKCSCVDKYASIQASKNEPFKNAVRLGGMPLDINMMTEGLIPRKRAGDLLDFKVMGDRVSALCAMSGDTIDMIKYEEYKNAMRNILSYLIAQKEMDYSVLISAPNGFSKTTFVYSCLKLMLLNGNRTVPFVPLFELAQLRYDYMLEKTWRRSDNFDGLNLREGYTDTEAAIIQQSSYQNRLSYKSVQEVKEQKDKLKEKELEYHKADSKKFIDMTDAEKEEYIMQVRSKKYNYQDYLEADILFCQLSVAEQAYMEISTLKAVMEYRGMHCKPTVIITDRDIEVYKTTVGMATDIHFLNEMLVNDINYATYDRAYIVAVKKKRDTKLKGRAGVDI